MNPSSRRMLIVDDEQLVCQGLEEYFGGKGYAITTAFSGEEALSALTKDGPFDVLLLDIMLPGIHGLEVLKRAKQLHPRARVVIMTALDHGELVESARANGADAFIRKPFNLSDATWASALA